MLTVGISGAAGRMGRELVRAAWEDAAIAVGAGLEHAEHPALGQDLGRIAECGELGIALSTLNPPQTLAKGLQLLIEFSTVDATLAHLRACCDANCPMLIGTTGIDAQGEQAIRDAGARIPVLLAANTSVGVNLCLALVETAARVLGAQTDIEIVEMHHRHKVDAPSGTALALGRAAAKTLGKDLEKDAIFSRIGATGARPDGRIGFATLRGGDNPGEHTVLFLGDGERVEITHRATSRRIFAIGAIKAAKWLAQQKPGFYTMRDALGLATQA